MPSTPLPNAWTLETHPFTTLLLLHYSDLPFTVVSHQTMRIGAKKRKEKGGIKEEKCMDSLPPGAGIFSYRVAHIPAVAVTDPPLVHQVLSQMDLPKDPHLYHIFNTVGFHRVGGVSPTCQSIWKTNEVE